MRGIQERGTGGVNAVRIIPWLGVGLLLSTLAIPGVRGVRTLLTPAEQAPFTHERYRAEVAELIAGLNRELVPADRLVTREGLWAQIGALPPREKPQSVRILSDTTIGEVRIRRLALASHLGISEVRAVLAQPLVPRPGHPGVLALHGQWTVPEDVMGIGDSETYAGQFGLDLASDGYTVIAPFLISNPVRLEYMGALAQRTGHTLEQLQLDAIVSSIDYLEVELGIGLLAAYGISMGGKLSALAGALDERIDVAVVNGSAGDPSVQMDSLWATTLNAPRYYHGAVATWMTGPMADVSHTELYRLIHPRPLMLEYGSEDPARQWDPRREFDETRTLYAEGGIEDRIRYSEFEGGHQIDPALGARGFLDRWLTASSPALPQQ